MITVGWEELNYTITEGSVGRACLLVLDPPGDEALAFDVLLQYHFATGTAGTTIDLLA